MVLEGTLRAPGGERESSIPLSTNPSTYNHTHMEESSQTSVNLFLGNPAPSCVFEGTSHAHSEHTYMQTKHT